MLVSVDQRPSRAMKDAYLNGVGVISDELRLAFGIVIGHGIDVRSQQSFCGGMEDVLS